jgi:hypothetical protein
MFLKIVKQTMTSKYFCTIRDFKKSTVIMENMEQMTWDY